MALSTRQSRHSLEASSCWQCLLSAACLLSLAALLSYIWPIWWLWLLLWPLALRLNHWQWQSRAHMLSAFNRASVQLEALHNQDYSLQAKAAYRAGIAATFQHQLFQLSEQLQQRKSFFDEQQFLLYRLIDQLNTPILVFDHKQQLSYANNDFITLFGQPWQSLRHTSASKLGLNATPYWHFRDPKRNKDWQIRHSRFLEQGQRHQLLVFINIQAALSENELQAWQQLIRVLSHEIRNSLTPVLALSEHLKSKLPAGREQDALALIGERSRHLQDFVSRYSELSKPLSVQRQAVRVQQVQAALKLLFEQQAIQGSAEDFSFNTDAMLLQQVLINLIKNAKEAGSPPGTIELHFQQGSNDQPERSSITEIHVLDQGHGLNNARDIFVPFYSTKPQGQGIGLALCQHIIKQLGGELTLQNRTDGRRGCCARILLDGSRPVSE
ncbi:sensor histidine kinase [Alkalimonas amylolytica]|uniref:histidine kinase n=1 Tax=Alkalimonas amylolytica TaxID=152573 RepID=A0A1H4G2I1_ALKAM|nr:ATP-binding protein [Alkalimonas amylolytica]SEB03744.1 His Kinase A (phospho-acceptor) domain-containing protein [Alkalimonas amylolytica]